MYICLISPSHSPAVSFIWRQCTRTSHTGSAGTLIQRLSGHEACNYSTLPDGSPGNTFSQIKY